MTVRAHEMVLLVDVGNTHTHIGVADERRVRRSRDLETRLLVAGGAAPLLKKFVGASRLMGACICSVVPRATPHLRNILRKWGTPIMELNAGTVRGVGVKYPKPGTIGPDRLANAVAVRRHFGAPAVVVDFGTAVTFDVVDNDGDYVGGIIAPGLEVMTEYLHEKTALLPRIRIQPVSGVIGKSTRHAMLVGAVYGYRGLVRELIARLKKELRAAELPVVATGSYAEIIASELPEITAVEPGLTLEGLRLEWQQYAEAAKASRGGRGNCPAARRRLVQDALLSLI